VLGETLFGILVHSDAAETVWRALRRRGRAELLVQHALRKYVGRLLIEGQQEGGEIRLMVSQEQPGAELL
jgi:hypothetical protein